ncbi:DNA (cytosine-5-)-methyltransferase [Fischerella thermalis CCMEE 5268]|uniref:Cytosine-specific methyltransferase n=1 Tax=Fischerella thermalis CCMEE 5268 TaxID=2019662 RepID=A0A2N6KAM6_9CYAN|nr:DNA cytosine methyltransferase [Fischerella thermalis]PLZ95324.1 DNA (cytosine-5-)-methyltransferase [Fischerella thermalis CCMEE 5268]
MDSKQRPIGVDLFAGAGGMSLGFEQAGFDVLCAVELDPIHCATHKFNFPFWSILCKSVEDTTGEEIRNCSAIGSQEIDVVFGGSPCQGYSYMGRRALDDPRNFLVKDFIRIVLELKPSYFVFENVKGLTIGKHKCFLHELIETFSNNNYQIRLPWKVLNAAYYGIPQKRERLFIIGAKKGFVLPEYPAICSQPPSAMLADSILPLTPSCWDALKDLPEAEEFEELLYSDCVETEKWSNPSNYGREMRCLDDRSWHFGYRRNWNPFLLTSSIRTNHSQISRTRFHATEQGKKEPISRFFKLAENGIANTLRAGTDAAHGSHTSPRPIHYSSPRCITVREMARLHGFPDWFRFHITKWHGARQVGNSVPPPLARAIGAEIMKCLGINPTTPEDILELGDPKLLSMTMKQAANYWQFTIPTKHIISDYST